MFSSLKETCKYIMVQLKKNIGTVYNSTYIIQRDSVLNY